MKYTPYTLIIFMNNMNYDSGNIAIRQVLSYTAYNPIVRFISSGIVFHSYLKMAIDIVDFSIEHSDFP